MLIFRQTSEIVSPLARSRSISRSSRATSSAVRRFFMGPSLAHSTEGLPFQVDQFLGGRPRPWRTQGLSRQKPTPPPRLNPHLPGPPRYPDVPERHATSEVARFAD